MPLEMSTKQVENLDQWWDSTVTKKKCNSCEHNNWKINLELAAIPVSKYDDDLKITVNYERANMVISVMCLNCGSMRFYSADHVLNK